MPARGSFYTETVTRAPCFIEAAGVERKERKRPRSQLRTLNRRECCTEKMQPRKLNYKAKKTNSSRSCIEILRTNKTWGLKPNKKIVGNRMAYLSFLNINQRSINFLSFTNILEASFFITLWMWLRMNPAAADGPNWWVRRSQRLAEAGRAYFLALNKPFTENRLKCCGEGNGPRVG